LQLGVRRAVGRVEVASASTSTHTHAE
jgi:hypothetical protein